MINFSQDEIIKLDALAKFYFKLKALMLYSETLGNQEIFLPPVNEIRLSHDRILRFISAKCEPNGSDIQPNGNDIQPNGGNGSVELDKAMSSIYNAIMASLDYISICQLEYIENLNSVDHIDYGVIEQICPGTHALIPEIQIFQKKVQDLKSKGNPIAENELDTLIKNMTPIQAHIERVKASKNTMIEHNQRVKYEHDRKSRNVTIERLVAALLGAAAVVVLEIVFR